ncbi:DUF6492 family protein [Spongiactinospora sp. TRM90649]|uniref:DUF6492 family protein n=1 Tax=Spongiactinospora sp. TRM90649 TaxID=3031114 RepID=UPI0023F66B11|nr:DUF6492 family protein [Spongiactinospora sp. TRM90649]MDF5752463.1 DUF6492 family protein [Spongiactinospora sp. TRM90649]
MERVTVSKLAVITPSYGPDSELFTELHRSVLRHTSDDTVHHVIVPTADKTVFSRFESPRCRIWTEPELLSGRYARIPGTGLWVNLRRPWPPVRGWVIQQALKIAAAGIVDADVVLLLDSDVVLVRPTDVKSFTSDGKLCLYRVADGVHAGMERHVRWHQVARDLLGLPPVTELPLDDYVSSLNFWDPAVVRAMQQRITEVTGRPWMDAFNAQLHISEFILYGVYVDEIVGATAERPPSNTSICHNRWDRTPLDLAAALAFAERLNPSAIGMMISAKSKTPWDVRLAAVERCDQVAGA